PAKKAFLNVFTSGAPDSKLAGGPAAMTASVPPLAPAMPPDTGAWIQAMPRSLKTADTRPAIPGPLVERSTIVFAREPRPTPSSTTDWTMAGVGKLTKTMSALLPTSSGDDATVAPAFLSAAVAPALA